MRLERLSARNFRCLVDFEMHLDALTVLIGENDVGKSSVLDILGLVLNSLSPDDEDFCDLGDGRTAEIEVVLSFSLEPEDDVAVPYSRDGVLTIRQVFTQGSSQRFYLGEKCIDERLNQNIDSLKKAELEELITEFDAGVLSEMANNDQRKGWLQEYAQRAPRTEAWVETPRRWEVIVPTFERYSALDYQQPENIVMKTLRQVYLQVIHEPVEHEGIVDGGEIEERHLIQSLREIEKQVYEAIQERVLELKDLAHRFNPRLVDLSFVPTLDFSGALRTGGFTINDGRGHHYLSKSGDGTKRRMLLAVLEWDRQIALEQSQEAAYLPTVIRGYDEPDTNLHYDAQHQVLDSIAQIATAEHSNIQALVCTHSLAMIDRTPAQSIRLLTLDKEGHSHVTALEVGDDEEVITFLSQLAREFGITNTLMFYERCFLLVEGHTEKNALPILYRRLYGRSLIEDGIVLVDLDGNGAARPFLRLLNRNKKEAVVILVDRDAEESGEASLTGTALREAGFDDDFITERLCLVGSSEFEDAFSNADIVKCLQTNWPIQDEEDEWTEEKIDGIRQSGAKFSKELIKSINRTNPPTGHIDKSVYGIHIAERCDEIPAEIIRMFEVARAVSGTN